MNYKLSVIVPALNEEGNIVWAVQNIIESFQRVGCSAEIIVVNDGSTDRTGSLVNGLSEKYPFIRMLCHDKPRGLGASYWDGVQNAQGEVVMYVPGDGENDAYEIMRYLPLLDHVDIVIPFFYNRNVRSWSRRLISKTYKGIINLTFGILLNYMNGPVMYRKCVLDDIDLRSTGFFYQTELLIKCLKRGYLYAEVSSALYQRLSGESKALTFKTLFRVMVDYLATVATIYIFDRKNKLIVPNSVTALRHRQFEEFLSRQAKS
ncbi:MAG: hypothetical protein HW406_1180 [Candidatus Brocadiaceae bacterium]|nr:hypothetical protein [Candidatus Brocadiaceae bacterium]